MTAGDEPMQPGMHSSSSQDGFNLRLLFFAAFLMFCLFFSNVKPCRFQCGTAARCLCDDRSWDKCILMLHEMKLCFCRHSCWEYAISGRGIGFAKEAQLFFHVDMMFLYVFMWSIFFTVRNDTDWFNTAQPKPVMLQPQGLKKLLYNHGFRSLHPWGLVPVRRQ